MTDSGHRERDTPAAKLAANVAVRFERAEMAQTSVHASGASLPAELEHRFAREQFCASRADSLASFGGTTRC